MQEFTIFTVAYARTAKPAPGGAILDVKKENIPATEEAAGAETAESGAETAALEERAEGLSIQPSVVAFQALNFLLLVVVLHRILYKPLVKLLSEREKRIREGVENAEKADAMLKESNTIRQDMIKGAKAESQDIMEKARKSGEELKTGIIQDAHQEADKVIKAGHTLVEMEKAKTSQELKANAVNMIIAATEKVLREKVDPARDAKLIEESLTVASK